MNLNCSDITFILPLKLSFLFCRKIEFIKHTNNTNENIRMRSNIFVMECRYFIEKQTTST